MTRLLIWFAVAGALIWGAGVSTAGNIGFDGLQHGEIVDDQFEAAQGVTISAENFNPHSGHPDLAVAFDSNQDSTRDPDLEAPWKQSDGTHGNIDPTTNLGLMLIIQENDHGISDGIADDPDDEGRRPAGQLTFVFDDPIDSFGFDLADIEHQEVSGGYFASFYNGNSQVAQVGFHEFEDSSSVFYDSSINFAGDNTANRISPLAAAKLATFGGTSFTSFDTVVIQLGGSGAVDNLVYDRRIPPSGLVPLPNGAWMGLALLGLLGTFQAVRRRRRRRLAA